MTILTSQERFLNPDKANKEAARIYRNMDILQAAGVRLRYASGATFYDAVRGELARKPLPTLPDERKPLRRTKEQDSSNGGGHDPEGA